ncbi:endonuclease/exonuclease/phosphatase superfamily [Holotrichia oblita]|uniref:Endonuclease/exonuclease/phosphatase superfamily n=1 Tax=Holotrichia oblita TaxID=644536 RepID=A0ACB9TVF8_HOLOL|nr:endonuclease/exonuclease/phosphatase superfamily [Holotrichia oblita]
MESKFLRLHKGSNIEDSTESDPEDNIPLIMLCNISNTGESSTKKGKIAEKEPNWTDEIIDITMNQGNGYLAREDIVKQELAGLNPFQIVEKLFDDEIITYITKETQRYAAQQNNHSFTVTNNEIKIFIAPQYFQNRVKGNEWIKDTRVNVAVLCLTRNIEAMGHQVNDGHLILRMKNVTLVCCYVSPNIQISDYKEEVDEIMKNVNNNHSRVLGDINAKSAQWGSPTTDEKGKYWTEWISSTDMVVQNRGSKPTFVRG